MDWRKSLLQILYFVIAFLVIVLVLNSFSYRSQVLLGGKIFNVAVVETKALQEKGLSGQKDLNSDEGMLFIFNKPDNYGFWMKGMLFPIDILWMDQNWRIIHIENFVKPETYPKIFYPNSPS